MKHIFIFCFVVILLASCGGNSRERGKKTGTANTPKTDVPQAKPVVNFYMEISSSMDGYYAKGVTEFKQALYSYLSDVKIANIADTLNLFYVIDNTTPIAVVLNADIDAISHFIEKFDASTFSPYRTRENNYTNVADIIKLILGRANGNSIEILVSYFIYSPSATKNPEEHIFKEQIGIKNTMATKFKIENPAFVVYQLWSGFNGQFFYFDKNIGREISKIYKSDRNNPSSPFYIWIIGDVKNVAELCQKVPETKFKGQNEVKVFSVMAGTKAVNYAVKPHSGNFALSRKNTKTDIDNLSKDSRSGKVKFSVNVDFSNLLLDDAYLTDANNYELNNKEYQINVKSCPPNEHSYTHMLSFTADRVYKGTVSVKLKKQKPLPQWIEDANDDDGSIPKFGKTYGIKYLIEGIFEGFTLKDPYYTEIKININ
ncbi:hypothetical protein FACS1894182_14870 [Bacteroidia bacterium]|nr:hypothetical protein FACS1894182_14870 [Bacteroidia bacterium]